MVPSCRDGAFSGATLLGQVSILGALEADKLVNLQTLLHNVGGSAGEISALALLAGWVYLLVRRVIKPWITLSIFATVALVACIFHAVDPASYTGPLFNLLTGGVILGACFMATDYVTSPITAKGKLIFGFGCGLLCMLIRQFGSYPEGCSFAILIMNALCPLVNRWTQPKPFGAK